jgi:hypothetical protein
MGRGSDLNKLEGPMKLHLQYVPFNDGCYDQGGAYWGMPANLYVAWVYLDSDIDPDVAPEDDGCRFDHYVRANSREDAKTQILEEFPEATFYR